MRKGCGIIAAVAAVTVSSIAFGQVNGTLDAAEYGATNTPLAVQTTPTGFGNNQSEINALYAKPLANGGYQFMLTGNAENNGNGLVIMLDARAGGAVGTSLPGGYGVFGSVAGDSNAFTTRISRFGTDWDSGAGVDPQAGSIFSPGFNPEMGFEINAANAVGTTDPYYINRVDMTLPNDPPPTLPAYDDRATFIPAPSGDLTRSGTLSVGAAVFTTVAPVLLQAGAVNAGTITHAWDNTNTLGVNGTGDPTPGDPLTATQGFETEISAQLMNQDPGDEVKIFPFITNNGGDYLANQFLPGLPGGTFGNLGTNQAGGGRDPNIPLFDTRVFTAIDPNWKSYVTLGVPEWQGAGPAGEGGNSWSINSNWISANPDGQNVTAKFGAAGGGGTVDVDVNKTLGGIIFEGANYTLSSSGGSIALSAFAGKNARINVRSGNQTIFAPTTVSSNLRLSVAGGSTLTLSGLMTHVGGTTLIKDGAGVAAMGAKGGNVEFEWKVEEGESFIIPGTGTTNIASLTIASGAKLDLTDNRFNVNTGGAIATAAIRTLITSGYNGGNWNGTGITSSTAAAAASTRGVGYLGSASDVKIAFTLLGDTDLNRSVNLADFSNLTANFNTSGKEWFDGDFNYDGNVNLADFSSLTANFNQSIPAPLPGSAIPEPTTLSLIGLAALANVRRRR